MTTYSRTEKYSFSKKNRAVHYKMLIFPLHCFSLFYEKRISFLMLALLRTTKSAMYGACLVIQQTTQIF